MNVSCSKSFDLSTLPEIILSPVSVCDSCSSIALDDELCCHVCGAELEVEVRFLRREKTSPSNSIEAQLDAYFGGSDGISSRLTKTLLMGLPEESYLVSNVWESGKSIFSELVAPVQQREAQWRRMVTARANGRLCYIYKSKAEYDLMRVFFPNPALNLVKLKVPQ